MNIFGSIFGIIAAPLGWIMKQIYLLVGNYGISLILFTLFTKVIMFPLAIKQKKSTIKMSAFNPIIQDIQKKYANDKVKQQEELQRLQTEHGFSMTAGCLPMLVQFPLLFGLIDVVYKPLRYIAGISNDVITSLTPVAESVVGTLSKYSPQSSIITAVQQSPQSFKGLLDENTLGFVQNFDFTFLGMDLTATPTIKVFNLLLLIPFLSVGFMIAQQILTTKLNGQKMEGAMKIMPIYTGAMFLYFGFVMPAGVSIYWIFSSIFGILQELLLRIFFDPEKEKAKIENEIMEARKELKNKNKAKAAVKKALPKADKDIEPVFESSEEASLAQKRLEAARKLDKEKYGE